jgi:hypothetical protein
MSADHGGTVLLPGAIITRAGGITYHFLDGGFIIETMTCARRKEEAGVR